MCVFVKKLQYLSRGLEWSRMDREQSPKDPKARKAMHLFAMFMYAETGHKSIQKHQSLQFQRFVPNLWEVEASYIVICKSLFRIIQRIPVFFAPDHGWQLVPGTT